MTMSALSRLQPSGLLPGDCWRTLASSTHWAKKCSRTSLPSIPQVTLAYIEEAAATNAGSFFDAQNANRVQIIRVLRSLAYDPALFERSAKLLIRFALSEAPESDDPATDSLKSLFGLYPSGTHATAAQRAAFVQTLLESSVASERECGLALLGEMLKVSYFTSSHSFEFGAWKRDYGFHPEHGDQVRDWFKTAIEMGRVAEASGKIPSARVRHVMANHVAQLLQTGMIDEVIALANAFAEQGGWPEGWIGVRTAMKRQGHNTSGGVKEVRGTGGTPSPGSEIVGRSALMYSRRSGAHSTLPMSKRRGESKLLEAREKVHESCIDLGQQLARDPHQFDAMLSEIIASESQKTLLLGRGLGMGCASVTECWCRLRDEFLGRFRRTNPGRSSLGGFLSRLWLVRRRKPRHS